MIDILLVFVSLIVMRFLYLVATLFITRDVTAWSEGLLRVERAVIRWWAVRGLTEEEKRHVQWMRHRISRGLPPF